MEPQGFADALGVGSERRREIKDGADMFAVGTCGYIVTTEMGKIEKGIDLGERSECGLEPLSFEFPWNSQWKLECGDWNSHMCLEFRRLLGAGVTNLCLQYRKGIKTLETKWNFPENECRKQ